MLCLCQNFTALYPMHPSSTSLFSVALRLMLQTTAGTRQWTYAQKTWKDLWTSRTSIRWSWSSSCSLMEGRIQTQNQWDSVSNAWLPEPYKSTGSATREKYQNLSVRLFICIRVTNAWMPYMSTGFILRRSAKSSVSVYQSAFIVSYHKLTVKCPYCACDMREYLWPMLE